MSVCINCGDVQRTSTPWNMKIKLSRKVRHESKVADDEVNTREPEVERNAEENAREELNRQSEQQQ